ncbi:peptidoglycan DD-metalloendopeptidase family protein [Fulvivirgaceae bacterium BMA10]|uniref:Peptidoglycan DD-metalloendopeptidase family protein n=1 Tax=Splendidivirga corallicola TaxID=3051826 RepID=A0ABT8KX39_9BACT|nr:peptidoglycan DD-metalloendopeptidase family protein [Fulvivirgaceae bacterium BMA10]
MIKRKFGIIAGILIIVCICFALIKLQQPVEKDQAIEAVEIIPEDTVEVNKPEPTLLYGMVVDSLLIIEDKIQRNQNISEILMTHNVSSKSIHELALASRDIFDVRKIRANKKYTLICDSDSMQTVNALVYEPNPIEYVVFKLKDSISIERKKREVQIVEKSIAGIIESSLFETMVNLGVGPQLTNEFVDVFAWQVDFQRLQKGDRFKLIYEDKIVEGKSVGIGDIKGIYFNHFGNDFYAVHFDQGNGHDYFDEEGNSLRKALLKYPIKFTRISSRFSLRRFHPVQKRWKAHRGTDFAAPRGTEIRTVGDGIVQEAQFGKYNGNYVKIRHNGTYTTQYLHMSKIASGIRAGVKVRQGDVIGYVGSTGLARGNHLCYRFWKNGVQVDALRVELPPSEPIREENLADFNSVKDIMIGRLNDIDYPELSKSILASAK